MSLYIALDTATDIGSVAAGSPGTPAAEVIIGRRRHAADLVPAIDEVLRLADATWDDVSALVVADGPGSFTGLRIGFATAHGAMRARPALPLFTAPSLVATALLASQMEAGPVAAMYDALRGEVYAVVCDFSGPGRMVFGPELCTVATLAQSGVRARIAVGDGAALYAAEVERWTGRAPVGPPAGAPRASMLIELAGLGLATRVSDPAAWEPNYGRPAEAQARWERKHGRVLPGAAGG